ncbi:WD40 repeat domain-containing protein [Phormidesmis priestleyi]
MHRAVDSADLHPVLAAVQWIQHILSTAEDRTLWIWDVSQISGTPLSEIMVVAGEQPASPIANLIGSRVNIRAVQFSPDGQHLVASEGWGSLTYWIWDISDNRVSPGGQYALTIPGVGDKTVRLRNVSGKLIAELKEHQDRITSANFSLNSRSLTLYRFG